MHLYIASHMTGGYYIACRGRGRNEADRPVDILLGLQSGLNLQGLATSLDAAVETI